MENPIHVLLIDDEAEYVESLSKVLGRRGVSVTPALDGSSGVEKLSGGSFEVIVLDLRMPGMDGLKTLTEIRKVDPATPVLLVSGQGDLASVSRALRAGITDFLAKPCSIDVLVSAIEDAAERKALSRAAQAVCARVQG